MEPINDCKTTLSKILWGMIVVGYLIISTVFISISFVVAVFLGFLVFGFWLIFTAITISVCAHCKEDDGN